MLQSCSYFTYNYTQQNYLTSTEILLIVNSCIVMCKYRPDQENVPHGLLNYTCKLLYLSDPRTISKGLLKLLCVSGESRKCMHLFPFKKFVYIIKNLIINKFK